MRLLKFFLWITLLICTAWGAAIFLGPTLINRAVAAYFGDVVKIQRLNVSPTLEVSAAAVEFEFPGDDGATAMQGISRGVSINWVIEEVIQLDIGLGPTRVDDVVFASSVDLSVKPTSNFDWSVLGLQGKFENLAVGPHEAAFGRLSAQLNTVEQVTSEVEIDVERIDAEVHGLRAQIPIASIVVDNIKIGLPIAVQSSKIGVQFPGGATYAGADLKSAVIQGQLEGGVVNFEVSGSEVVMPDAGFSFNNFDAIATFDAARQVFGSDLDFSLKDITAQALNASIDNYAGKITRHDAGISHSGSGNISSLLLRSSENFIGEVSGAELKLDFSAVRTDASQTNFSGAAEISLKEEFDLAVAYEVMADVGTPLRCLSSGCALSQASIEFVASVPGGRLIGASSCSNSPCGLNNYRHTVRTDDTDKFFEGVSAARVFSPLAVPFAYAVMKRGVQKGSGHSLEF